MSGKEPDFLLKLGIKYENLITDICKLKEPTDEKDKELQVVTNFKSEAEGGKCSCKPEGKWQVSRKVRIQRIYLCQTCGAAKYGIIEE